MSMESRGQAEVLGTVLLVGIVVSTSVLIMGVAMGSFGGMESQSEGETIERALMDLRSAAADVAIEGDATRSVMLGIPDDAIVRADPNSSAITITHIGYRGNDSDESEVLYTIDGLGAVEIEHGDATYGLEGGGIFKVEDGSSTLISPPNFGLSGFTANIPILRIDGAGSLQRTAAVSIEPGEHIRPAFPNQSRHYTDTEIPWDNPVVNGSVEMTIQSDYYEGWAQFFEQYTDGNVTLDHANETVTMQMESLDRIEYTQGITFSKSFNEHGNSVTYDDFQQTEFLPGNGPIIEDRLGEAYEYGTTPDNDTCGTDSIGGDDCVLSEELYYFEDGLTVVDDVEIDTSSNDVQIVVDGDFDLQGDITVTGDSGNGTEYFVTDDFNTDGDHTIGTDSNATEAHRNLMHIGGESVYLAGSVWLDVIIYAPDAYVDMRGTATVTGSIMADELVMRGDATVQYDQGLDELDGIDLSETETPIMYLHITENTAVFDF